MKRSGSNAQTAKAKVPRRAPPIRSTTELVDPTVWHSLAASRMLTTPELGRLLLWTSATAFTDQNDQDDKENKYQTIWKMLCINHWGAETVKTLLEITNLTPKDHFFAFGFPPKKIFTLPPLRYTPDDYIMILQVRKLEVPEDWRLPVHEVHPDEGQLLFCEAFEGMSIPIFFQCGSTEEIELKHPFETYCGLEESFNSTEHTDFHWEGTIDLMRRPDCKVIRLLDCQVHDRIGHLPTSVDGNLEIEYNSSSLGSVSGLKDNPVLRQFWNVESVVDEEFRMGFEMSLGYKAVFSAGKAAICIHSFEVNAMFTNCSSPPESVREDDMEFSHVIESLPGWDDAAADASS